MFAEAVTIALFDVSPLLECQFYGITLTLSNISGLTFKHRFTSGAIFGFMLAHGNYLKLKGNSPVKHKRNSVITSDIKKLLTGYVLQISKKFHIAFPFIFCVSI